MKMIAMLLCSSISQIIILGVSWAFMYFIPGWKNKDNWLPKQRNNNWGLGLIVLSVVITKRTLDKNENSNYLGIF